MTSIHTVVGDDGSDLSSPSITEITSSFPFKNVHGQVEYSGFFFFFSQTLSPSSPQIANILIKNNFPLYQQLPLRSIDFWAAISQTWAW